MRLQGVLPLNPNYAPGMPPLLSFNTAILLGVIVIVGGLIYFPMLILGPIGERLGG